jgi:hypothetical protein
MQTLRQWMNYSTSFAPIRCFVKQIIEFKKFSKFYLLAEQIYRWFFAPRRS